MKQKFIPTIGFLIDWLENDYQVSLFSGISDRARELNVNLLAFIGGSINSSRKHEQFRNTIYDFVLPANVDGIIISSGSIGIFSKNDEMREFVGQFSAIPAVSISQAFDGLHSLIIDNSSGIKWLIRHFVRDHGYKRIALISGPLSNQEAVSRLDAYKAGLIECGIEYSDDLVVNGTFVSESGIEAVKTLFDFRHADPDAIIASNDDMAWGALEELRRRGIRVPDSVAIAGFDNQKLSRFTNPPLTTVAQPIYDQGRKAVELMMDLLNGKKLPPYTKMETTLVIRESCGCNKEDRGVNVLFDGKPFAKADAESETAVTLSQKVNGFFLSNPSAGKLRFTGAQIDELLVRFEAAISSCASDDFVRYINALLSEQKKNNAEEGDWLAFLSFFRSLFTSTGFDEKTLYFDNLAFRAMLAVKWFFERENDFKKESGERRLQLFRDISEEIVSQSEINSILTMLGTQLGNLNIKECYISLYDGYIKPNQRSLKSRLIFAQNEMFSISMNNETFSFRSSELLPQGIIPESRRFSLIVEPIFFGELHLGVALFEMSVNKGFVYNIMRRMILNEAVKATAFIQQMKSQAVSLELANTELKGTLKTLKTTQAKLIQAEKMAALGGLVAGMAHEINTPLGVAVTATSHMEKLLDDLALNFSNTRLKKSDLEKYIENTQKTLRMILYNLTRSHDLIRSFKMIAVDQSSEERRMFNVREYVEEIFLSLTPKLKKTKHRFEIVCPKEYSIFSFPGAFAQIITNLVMNSVIHAFGDDEKGMISISIGEKSGLLALRYSDDGKGIDEKYMSKVFTPFFTTRRGKGGTGLGLYIVYNIVTQKLGGSIEYLSSEKKGAAFLITIPMNENDLPGVSA
jgi:DNA-binding LacI/PurR family transcriptional regulator/signal transduction histidine kinase